MELHLHYKIKAKKSTTHSHQSFTQPQTFIRPPPCRRGGICLLPDWRPVWSSRERWGAWCLLHGSWTPRQTVPDRRQRAAPFPSRPGAMQTREGLIGG